MRGFVTRSAPLPWRAVSSNRSPRRQASASYGACRLLEYPSSSPFPGDSSCSPMAATKEFDRHILIETVRNNIETGRAHKRNHNKRGDGNLVVIVTRFNLQGRHYTSERVAVIPLYECTPYS